MGKVFISYRRADTDFAHRIADGLRALLDGEVFIDSRLKEENFDDALENHIRTSSVFVLIVTAHTFAPERIHQPDDWVRREIVTALQTARPITMALRQGQTPPEIDALPDDLREITRKQAIFFYVQDFEANVRALAEHCVAISHGALKLKQTTPATPPAPTTSSAYADRGGVAVGSVNNSQVNIQTGPSRRAELIQARQQHLDELVKIRRAIGELSYVPPNNTTASGFIAIIGGGILAVVIGFNIHWIVGLLAIAAFGWGLTQIQGQDVSTQQSQQITRLENKAREHQQSLKAIERQLEQL